MRLLALLFAVWGCVVTLRAVPPNILFILTDDQGWPTLGSYGNQLVPTPHLDRLAREGMRRAALLTGQHTCKRRSKSAAGSRM